MNNLKITISFDSSTGNEKVYETTIRKDGKLNEEIENFFKSKNIELNKKYFLYLKRNGKTLSELSESEKVSSLKIEENDEIKISYKKKRNIKNKVNKLAIKEKKEENLDEDHEKKKDEKNEIVSKEKNKKISIEKYDPGFALTSTEKIEEKIEPKTTSNKMKVLEDNRKKSYCYNKIFWIILFLAALLTIGGLCYVFIRDSKKKEEEKEYKQDELIVNKNYPVNYLLRFICQKTIEIEIEEDNNQSTNRSQLSYFIFIVSDKKPENDENNLIKKELYTGYIAVLKDSMRNDTKDIISIYDVKLNEYLNGNINFAELEKSRENINSCFAKIEFYLNGEIKNYYLPKGFNENLFIYIEELTQLMIPKISSNLYSKNIDEEMNKSINSYENRLRNLESKEKNREIYNYKK